MRNGVASSVEDPDLAEILAHPDISAPLSRRNLSSEDLTRELHHAARNKFLVNVSIVDSAGPLRFVVDANATVEQVIKHALQEYELEGRLPKLGTNSKHFQLYSAHDISEALDPTYRIGEAGVRDFIVHIRPGDDVTEENNDHPESWRSRLLRTVAAHFTRGE